MREFVDGIKDKKPNDAHIALAEYGIPIIINLSHFRY